MNSPLETYLDELGKGLKPLPIHERLEQLDEARAHLEGLTESYRELGHEEQESQVRAVAQFGDVKTVARELSRAVRKQNLWHAAGVAAIFFTIQNVVWRPFGMLLIANGPSPYVTEIMVGSGILANLIAGVVLRRLVPGNTLRPLILLSAVYLLILCMDLLRYWLQLGSVGGGIAPQWTAVAFLTSGALQELRYALRRWRTLA